MKVFLLKGVSNENMVFLAKDSRDLRRGIATGSCITESLYQHPPELILRSHKDNQRKWKGKALKVPDIGCFAPGSVIVSQKAEQCIGAYLRRFGDLNEIQVEGETWYNYLVTNVLTEVINMEHSTKSRGGTIKRAVFFADRLPRDSQIFKIPETGLVPIYFNTNHGENIGDLIHRHGLEAGDVKCVWDSEQ